MLFKNLPHTTQIILSLQAIGMLMGTSTHLAWVLEHGFLSDHYKAPFLSRLFWDSLTFLDPLAAVLLFVRPKAGLYMVAVIITLDIVHNNVFYMDELYVNAPALSEWVVKYWMILGQIVFGIFVFLTFKGNLNAIKSHER